MFEAYLDIETTGLSLIHDIITVVGIYLTDGKDHKLIQLVDEEITGSNLLKALQDAEVIYTYNGSPFDLPFIKMSLGTDLARHRKHHDLMLDCWKINLYGGLKALEARLGIKRQLANVDGAKAIELWLKYKASQDQNFLAILLKYNEEDVLNLKSLKEKLFHILNSQPEERV
jgi:uncharacterized protein YprB with RNaseH-like and TPR domain